MERFYKTFDYKDSDLSEYRIRSDAKKSLKFIRKFYRKSTTLLDLGCGRGYLMDEAKKYGWNVSGVDYSSNVINYAKNVLHLDVKKDDIFQFIGNKKYDLVILNQVIEHVEDINFIIKKAKLLLSENGCIYIATPNMHSASSLIYKKAFEHLIPPEHINYFTNKSLRLLLQKHGYNIIASSTWGYPENMAGIIKKIFKRNVITSTSSEKSVKNNEIPKSNINLKILLFDKIFCGITYRLLDIFGLGINLQIIAQKI